MRTQTSSGGGTPERYCPTCEKSFTGVTRCPDDGTQLVLLERDDKLIGANLDGRYTMLERIGQGGMGAVYRATQHSVGRDVAVKVVRPDLFSDPTLIKRFLREAKLASRLTHPNAVAVLDFGQTTDGLFYLVMELLDGEPLDKVLKREGRLDPERAINIASQICDALDGAHELEIVHRDLKPGNVMLLPGAAGRDLVKVMDFGLAKSLAGDVGAQSVTRSGAMLGTPAYMPPELATGKDADARTDLYALGCILYVMLAGRLPFVAETLHVLVQMHAADPPPPIPGIPAALEAVVMKLLAKEPGDRYATADETHHALELARRRMDPGDITIGGGSSGAGAGGRIRSGRDSRDPLDSAAAGPTVPEAGAGFDATVSPAAALMSTVTPAEALESTVAPAPRSPRETGGTATGTATGTAAASIADRARSRSPRRVVWLAAGAAIAIAGVVAFRVTRAGDTAAPVAVVDAATPPPTGDAAAIAPLVVVDASPPPPVDAPTPTPTPTPPADAAPHARPDARIRAPRPDASGMTTPPPTTVDARPAGKPDAGTPF